MQNKFKIVLAVGLLLPLSVFGEDWTAAQQEVLAFEEACVTTNNVDELNACFHEDFEGWGMDATVPTTKADRKGIFENGFASFDADVLLFKPLSVIVKGNMAVVNYLTVAKITNKATDEVNYETQRWTDVCLKDGGKWTWIADHGVDISSD